MLVLPAENTLRLLHWLSLLSRDDLHTLVSARNMSPADLVSLPSLADALLEESRVTETLSSLSREELEALLALGEGKSASDLSSLAALGLVDTMSSTPILLIPSELLDGLDLGSATAPAPTKHPAAPEDSYHAGSLIEGLVCCVEDVLDELHTQTLPLNKDGSLGANATKTLSLVFGDSPDPQTIASLARKAGVCGVRAGHLHLGPRATHWLSLSRLEQWEVLARAWWDHLPEALTSTLSLHPTSDWHSDLASLLRYHYPLCTIENLEDIVAEAELLGLHRDRSVTAFGEALVKGTVPKTLGTYLPEPAPGVYATEDFTFLAPGPLRPAHRRTLSALAEKELGGLVPRFRITSASLIRALHRGVKSEGIVDSLRSVCQTPLPEGIVHLVEDTIRQSTAITIAPEGTGSRITVESEQRAAELLADPALALLSLIPLGPTEFATRWTTERAAAALQAAKYVSLVDLAPTSVSIATDDKKSENELEQAIERLWEQIEHSRASGVSASISGIIEVATANKIPLLITCDMGQAGLSEFVLEPKSLSNGRLRGIETKHQVERTIPVSSIVQAGPWTPPENTS